MKIRHIIINNTSTQCYFEVNKKLWWCPHLRLRVDLLNWSSLHMRTLTHTHTHECASSRKCLIGFHQTSCVSVDQSNLWSIFSGRVEGWGFLSSTWHLLTFCSQSVSQSAGRPCRHTLTFARWEDALMLNASYSLSPWTFSDWRTSSSPLLFLGRSFISFFTLDSFRQCLEDFLPVFYLKSPLRASSKNLNSIQITSI